MTGNQDLLLVLCLAGVGVLAVNAAIILWARRKKPLSEFQIFTQLFRSAQNPFEKSESQYHELSSLVKDLKHPEIQQKSEGRDEQ
jgi:hypothetical protein